MCAGASGNLILTGFMGTGKTAVGRAVAQRLARPFIDMDEEIQARAQKPIPKIFAEDGEAVFRQWESELCRELSARRQLVIATGGGALVNPVNRSLLMRSGTVVCLTSEVNEILYRVKAGKMVERPLLRVPDPRAEIERLLDVRHDAYTAIPWQIDTTGLSLDEVAAQVTAFASVITLPVRYPEGEYPIHIGRGLRSHIGGALRAAGVPRGGRVALVSNPVVAPIYADQVASALRTAELRPFSCSIPDGERYKTLTTVTALYDQFLAGSLDRSDTVLSLGGGVTGDVAGFAAASYMRGVRFVQVPTTLLAMVDASVGGKTGVDLPQGKNLVGAFKQPEAVVIDPTVLSTLSEEEMRSGMAEVIKHGIIGAPDLFAELERGDAALSSWWKESSAARIAQALRVKIEVVEKDPYEGGRRGVLNLGHTVGHALERLSGYAMRHGEAVAVGMVAAAQIAAELGRAESSLPDRIRAVLDSYGLQTSCPPFKADAICQAMTHDKKRRGRELRWVLPHAIGHVELAGDVPTQLLKTVLVGMGARRSQ